MPKLTDTDALKKAVRDDPNIDGLTYARIMRHIIEAKREDAVPVVHGRWRFMGTWEECSVCQHTLTVDDVRSNYCPNCGAKMDLEVSKDG